MKLFWMNDEWKTGSMWGFSVHSMKLKSALSELGVEFAENETDDYDLAVAITHPSGFRVVPGRPTVGFVQVEFDRPHEPEVWKEGSELSKAALLVTSCESSRKAETPYFKGRIEVCPPRRRLRALPLRRAQRTRAFRALRLLVR